MLGSSGGLAKIAGEIDQLAAATGKGLFFAFSPFASNFLFIAYGLTSSPLRLVAIPFFLGRFVSYSLFVYAAAEVSQRLGLSGTAAKNYFGIYFVASQFLFMGALYVFTRIDWKYALGLSLTDRGFHFSVLNDFRKRLQENKAEG